MTRRCKRCEQYRNQLIALRDRRVLLWRRGELSDAIAAETEVAERRLIEEWEQHQAAYHQPSLCA
jgi:hypothetical protein